MGIRVLYPKKLKLLLYCSGKCHQECALTLLFQIYHRLSMRVMFGDKKESRHFSAKQNVLNEVILNEYTYGVLCEMKWNQTLYVDYLRVETSQVSLPDTNHNSKKLRYQSIVESSPVLFGFYVYDPWILKIAEGVTKELIWVEDYAYNAAVLQLVSLKAAKAFLAFN